MKEVSKRDKEAGIVPDIDIDTFMKFVSIKNQNGKVKIGDLPPLMVKLKALSEMYKEEEIREILGESGSSMDDEIDFEGFLRTYVNLQSRAPAKLGGAKNSWSFLKATTTTLLHTISESEKSSYVAHINSYLRDDPFLKQFLPIDPATNALFDLAKDGVLLCKLINVAVPGTIDERAINTKRVLNPWERNENHTLCLNSAKAIGCTVVNIGTQDLIEGRDGEAYAYLLNVLAPEHCSPATLDAKDPAERANLVLEHAEKMDCKRYLTPKDIVEGSTNLNLAFVAQIFHQRPTREAEESGASFRQWVLCRLWISKSKMGIL